MLILLRTQLCPVQSQMTGTATYTYNVYDSTCSDRQGHKNVITVSCKDYS